ncbi:ArsR/SmtB family transcription factor [Sediminibacillus halophilus]|uniref:Regulatory protein, arsR family n=1 Tax=Sediminibacillus halophilus TaxID=482461 RepID=A0A1G9WX85_9BACI|nr:ArsR family transcriptional regulator [Sediminibacillus halophilus]SDM88766.1 regulatory protein, arsR family [Sediminibacillus halophilus]
MKQLMILETYEQLKSLSDPFRSQLMMRLIEQPYTGQQLAAQFNLSRAKIHYHLRELAKNGLVEIVRTEEKNGIVQKFYQSTARGFTPSEELLPYKEELSESIRQMYTRMLERTKMRVITAPEDAFKQETAISNPAEWSHLGSTWEISATKENFKQWIKKFFDLMEELRALSAETEGHPEQKLFSITAFGFEIDESLFQKREMKNQSKKESE